MGFPASHASDDSFYRLKCARERRGSRSRPQGPEFGGRADILHCALKNTLVKTAYVCCVRISTYASVAESNKFVLVIIRMLRAYRLSEDFPFMLGLNFLASIARLVVFACAGLAFCSPASAKLAKWPSYPTLASAAREVPWLIVKSAFSDEKDARVLPKGLNAEIPDLDTYIKLFLTKDGEGTGNIVDYYKDVSYGAISFSNSRVVGWYTLPFSKNNAPGRFTVAQQCANSISAADAATIDFDKYQGIVAVTNDYHDGAPARSAKPR